MYELGNFISLFYNEAFLQFLLVFLFELLSLNSYLDMAEFPYQFQTLQWNINQSINQYSLNNKLIDFVIRRREKIYQTLSYPFFWVIL